MEINERIENDYKQALKKRDEITISTLRMVKAAIHNKEIEKRGEKLKEAEVIKIIKKQVQQHQDSIVQFKKGKREELVEKETKELEILKKYLPKQLSPEEVANIVKKIIAQTGAKERVDFGKVMKLAMAEFGGKADGKLVSQLVLRQLNPPEKKEQ